MAHAAAVKVEPTALARKRHGDQKPSSAEEERVRVGGGGKERNVGRWVGKRSGGSLRGCVLLLHPLQGSPLSPTTVRANNELEPPQWRLKAQLDKSKVWFF